MAAKLFAMEMIMRRISLTAALVLGAGLAARAVPAAAQDVGVPSCDNFLKTYQSCVLSKAAEAQRATATAAIEQTKANWKAVAATADGKAQLDATCKETTEKMKKDVAALNCPW